MAKVTIEYPTELTMRLHAPGMSPLHRAGLGGLAASLRHIEQAYGQTIRPKQPPGGPWPDPKSPPWTITPGAIQLRWGEPTAAREYLRRLFAISFGLRDGLIDLPAQYGPTPPPLEVRASLQQGLTLTFLQHGKVRKLAKTPTVYQYDPEGTGMAILICKVVVTLGTSNLEPSVLVLELK
jgi:hypothetical protein